MYSTIARFTYSTFVGVFSYYYLIILLKTLLLFLLFRVPYCYSPYYFYIFLIVVVFSAFISLWLRRVDYRVNKFVSRFIPVGTPSYICPLVCLAETISYIIRPFVLILRPFINIRLGCVGAVRLGRLCMAKSFLLIVLFLVFLYEVFVALVHWYIVTNILSFSLDH